MPQKDRPINTIGKQFSLLIKPASADCNLSCGYCFYHQRSTDPYKSNPMHRMSDDVLVSLVSQYLSIAGQYSAFSWQGGEPLLMGIEFFKKVVEFQQMYGYSGQYVGNSLQTNAILITPDLAKLFHNYNFLLGISLDGPEEYHDHYRKNSGGNGTFNKVIESINILREHKVEFNILSVVNDLTAKKPDEIYRFFVENKFNFLQFIPAVDFDKETGQLTDYSVKAKDYGDFLCKLFDLWYNNGNPLISIRTFDNIATIYAGIKSEACVYMKECGSYAVIEYNGDVYPCDFFVEEPLLLGNLMETSLKDIVTGEKMQAFSRQKCNGSTQACQDCRWEYICHCGCQHYRFNGGMDYLCEAYQQFFAYTESRFKVLSEMLKRQIAHQNQQTASVKQTEVPPRVVGRNDPCPCGSGKKYKKCCMLE